MKRYKVDEFRRRFWDLDHYFKEGLENLRKSQRRMQTERRSAEPRTCRSLQKDPLFFPDFFGHNYENFIESRKRMGTNRRLKKREALLKKWAGKK